MNPRIVAQINEEIKNTDPSLRDFIDWKARYYELVEMYEQESIDDGVVEAIDNPNEW